MARVRAAIADGRREINRNNSPIARGILKPFYADAEEITGTAEWAELSLTMAESFSAENRKEAETYFREFFERVKEVPGPPPELLLRANENFAHFVFSVMKLPEKARPYYAESKALAVRHGFSEATARVQLRMVGIDLELGRDLQCSNFKLLASVARDGGFTAQQTFMAWTLHLEKLSQTTQGSRVFRNADTAMKQYFIKLLNQARNTEESEQLSGPDSEK